MDCNRFRTDSLMVIFTGLFSIQIWRRPTWSLDSNRLGPPCSKCGRVVPQSDSAVRPENDGVSMAGLVCGLGYHGFDRIHNLDKIGTSLVDVTDWPSGSITFDGFRDELWPIDAFRGTTICLFGGDC